MISSSLEIFIYVSLSVLYSNLRNYFNDTTDEAKILAEQLELLNNHLKNIGLNYLTGVIKCV